jgi:hypothetical protein
MLSLPLVLFMLAGGLGTQFPFPGPGMPHAQAASCTTPTGTTLTESFGDSTGTSCWNSGPSTCNNSWTIGQGTAFSIVSSPGTPPSNTSCANSLQMALAGADTEIYRALSKTQATAFDWYGEIYLTSHSIAQWNTVNIVTFDNRAQLAFFNSGGTLILIGRGSDNSSGITINTGTWYKVRLHLATGTGASYVSVNDGANDTFTQNANDVSSMVIGTNDSVTYTLLFGYVRVD